MKNDNEAFEGDEGGKGSEDGWEEEERKKGGKSRCFGLGNFLCLVSAG